MQTKNKINFTLTIFTRTISKCNLLFQHPNRNLIKLFKSFIQNIYKANYKLIRAILDSNHCQGFPRDQYSHQIRKPMETYIMVNTEALSHKITQDFRLFLQRNRSLLIADSSYSLTEIDFIDFIEITKTIIEYTETFNSFTKFINNNSFFLPIQELLQHKKFTKNIKFICKTTNQLFF
jgi:hypothetical protein